MITQLSEQLRNDLDQANDTIAKQQKLCFDSSDAYLGLPLKIVAPHFKYCAADLLQITQVPVILPTTVPQGLHTRRLHAYVDFFYSSHDTNIDRYRLGLTWFPGEYYQANTAYFEGERLTLQSSTLLAEYEKQIAWMQLPHYQIQKQESGAVELANGITGYYIASACGANCFSAYESVIWEQNGYRYRIALKVPQKSDLLAVVNDAIQNQASNLADWKSYTP